ncbi:hypothetical protein ACQ4M4_03590 [Leptolyngbya sp. AN02str]|uniref:hypothetical protein n=1 Tax=Leptolyngbya sp. AN02str TaxID=3423363 RepID=UPI003D310FFE
MLTHHRRPVCFSLISLDMPLISVVETAATLYEKEGDRFHLLLTEPPIHDIAAESEAPPPVPASPRLIWLEISPYRVTMTMQGNGKQSYRHYWEQGIFGLSRFWLQGDDFATCQQLRLRNYTRSLTLTREPQPNSLPKHLRVEYELWGDSPSHIAAHRTLMGVYVLNVEIQADEDAN